MNLDNLDADLGDDPDGSDEVETAGPLAPLSGGDRRALRALAHGLSPVITIGQHGLTEGLVAETRAALAAHELIKVRVGGASPLDRKAAGPALAEATGAALVQVIGKILVLYAPAADPEDRRIDLSADRREKRS